MTPPDPARQAADPPSAALAHVGGLEASGPSSKLRMLRSLRFMSLRDIGLFRRSARTDQAVRTLQAEIGSRSAFESVYSTLDDPWASDDRRYRYQRLKYAGIIAALPPGRRYARTLDLGCGLGLLSRALAARSDEVLGFDIAQEAVDRARRRAADVANLRFERADFMDLPRSLDGQFDLVTLADTLYYLPSPITDDALKTAAAGVGRLLAPGGLCLLANHYVIAADPDSRLTRRIHLAFAWSARLRIVARRRRPFYLVDLLETGNSR